VAEHGLASTLRAGAERPTSSDDVSALRLEPIPTLEAARELWDELAAATTNVFSTREWATTWYRHTGRGRPLLLGACRRGHEVVGLVPLYRWGERLIRVARFVGHGPADELRPLCAPGLELDVLELVCHDLGALGCDVLLAEQLPGDVEWGRLPSSAVVRRESSPRLRWTDGWGAFLSSRSANLRDQIGRRERRLRREHSVRYRLVEDSSALDRDLDTLFRLHRAVRPRTDFGPEAFHRDFARVALERGWLRFWILELDDRPAAAWYGFRLGGIESYYQAGRDPSLDHLSVGFVLLVHSIRSALDDGVREYRFGRGDEPYKFRLATEDPGVVTIAAGRGLRGSAAVRLATAARRARALSRR
jgi:CelD/BcsL family acetyltransferase involved in cellulose biosynthesis